MSFRGILIFFCLFFCNFIIHLFAVATWNKKMKTAILGAILILVPNLLDACMRKQGCKAKDPVNLAISLGGL